MQTSDFNYRLPKSSIAQKSVEPRDHSKLMVVNKEEKSIEHRQFFHILDYLEKGDVLVWNNSKVFKARLQAKLLSKNNEDLWEHKKDIELFLVRQMENVGVWKVLAKPARHVSHGMRIHIADDFYCDVLIKEKDGTILVQFEGTEEQIIEKANTYGSIPIPPYVKDEPHQLDMYQTIYAKYQGSVAAPTAGFHFTDELVKKIKEKGIEFAEVTLHVGLGTFLPVKSDTIEEHSMHSEWVELTEENATKINTAKKEGRRIIAVGTTTVRTLEGIGLLHQNKEHVVGAYKGDIDIFITPGFNFSVIDAMITNFHLPKSTLLMLVSAFGNSTEFLLQCYQEALKKDYRFYSFGDAMLVT